MIPFADHRTQREVRMSCVSCESRISHEAKHGRCRHCAARHLNETDPGIHERRAAKHRERWQDPEFRARQIAARGRHGSRQLGWCPRGYWDQYRHLVRSKHMKAADARRVLFDQIERDTRGLDPLAKAIKLAGLEA